MNLLHTLLAVTDLSAPSRHAAQRAGLLARDSGARLELLHVLETSTLVELRQLFGKNGAALQDSIRSQAREALAQLAADIGESQGVSAGCHLTEMAVLEGIIAQADMLDASLLIAGARGASFMRHWLLGPPPSACYGRPSGLFWSSRKRRAILTAGRWWRWTFPRDRKAPSVWRGRSRPKPNLSC